MLFSYNATPDSCAPDKPQPWSDVRYSPRPRGVGNIGGKPFDLHPDGERVAIAPAADAQTAASDKLVFVFNFFDELQRIVPVKK